jgi:hypothetical protein
VSVRHVMQKSDGSLYYHRRVPRDLRGHYGGRGFIRESLQTKSVTVAAKKARKPRHADAELIRCARRAEIHAAALGVEAEAAAVATCRSIAPGLPALASAHAHFSATRNMRRSKGLPTIASR